jgi:hypothetical protein
MLAFDCCSITITSVIFPFLFTPLEEWQIHYIILVTNGNFIT